MGNFFAHIFPGTIFTLIGWWFYYNTLKLYYKRGSHSHQNAFSTLIEPLLKIIVCFAGVLSECNSAKWMLFETETTNGPADWQHFTMYMLFAGTGVSDLLGPRYGAIGKTLSHMSYITAFVVETGLFYGHLHGRPIVDVQCHTLLTYSGVSLILALVYILYHPTSIIASSVYCSLVVLHGLWFCAVGFIVLSPFKTSKWDLESPEHAMLANVFFCWTFSGIVIAMLVFALLMNRTVQRSPGARTNRQEMNSLLSSDCER